MKKMNHVKRITAATLAGMLVMTGCGASEEVAEVVYEEPSVLVNIEPVRQGTLALKNTFVGSVSPEDTVSVFPMIAGKVTETFFEEGDVVNEGDVLFKIDSETAELALKQAQLAVESTQLKVDQAMGSAQDASDLQLEGAIDQAEYSYDNAQIAYVQSKENMKNLDGKEGDAKDAVNAANGAVEDAQGGLKKAEKATKKAKKSFESAKEDLKEAKTSYSAAKAALEEADPADPEYAQLVAACDAAKGAADVAEAKLAEKQGAYEAAVAQETAAQGSVSSAQAALSGAKSALTQIQSSQSSAQMAYYSAEAAYELAEKSLNRANQSAELTQGDALEDTEAQLENGLETAQLGVTSAELALSYYTVTAPVSGVVEAKNVDVNGMAAQSMPSYTIVNNDTMTATFQVSEDVRNTLTVGDKVVVTRNDNTYDATITEIGSSVNMATGLFEVKAAVKASAGELPNGVSVKIEAQTYEANNAILVPYDAVYYDINGAYVYVAKDGRAVKTPIETGIFNDDDIVVINGVSMGDMIVTTWAAALTDGVLLEDATTQNATNDANADAQNAQE